MDNPPSVDLLLKQLKDNDAANRRAAVKSLRNPFNERFLEPLFDLLNDSDDAVRLSTIKTLGFTGDKRAFEPLADLLEDSNLMIRALAYEALGKLGDQRAIEYFNNGLHDPSDQVRHSVAKGLRNFGGDETLALLEIALHDSSISVRRSATDGIGESKNIQAVDYLLSALQDEDSTIRRNAATQIGNILGGSHDGKSAIEAITKVMQDDEDDNVRSAAARTLGRIGDTSATAHLIPVCQNEKVKGVRLAAINALGWIRDNSATDALVLLLHHEDDDVRLNVVEALEKIRDPRVANRLAALLDDQYYRIRRQVTLCLSRIGGASAFSVLADALLESPQLVFQQLKYWSSELPDGKSKADYIIGKVLTRSSNSNTQLRPHLIFNAMLPTSSGKSEDQAELARIELCEVLIKEAIDRKNDTGMISILADLLCYGSPGRDKAADKIEKYQKEHSVPADGLEFLRKYVGGERALEPIMVQLKANLDNHFLEPIDSLNATTLEMWNDTVKQAKRGFNTRLYMSIVIFILGLLSSIIALYQFSFGNLDKAILFFGPGVTLAVGLASMIATFYTGPLREIEKSVTDLGVIHTAFIGYIHSVLEISQTFAALVLQQKMDFSEMKRANDLIKDAMTHTLGMLRPEIKRIAEAKLQQQLPKNEN